MNIALQSLILIACLLALVVLSHLLSRLLGRLVHREWLFYLLLAPGTVIHELCHASACLITLTPIYEVHLFRLRGEPDGTVQLGEVVHRDTGPIRNFLIAIAPLVGASVLIYFLSVLLLPRGATWTALLASGWMYLFLVAVFFVALGLSPSRQDMKVLPAFLIAVLVLVIVGYLVVHNFFSNTDLSGFQKSIETTLRSPNRGLLLVLIFVGIVFAVVLLVWGVIWLRSRRMRASSEAEDGR
jgi:hypothetical protein